MSHSTELAELLGLAGVEVDVVEREADGSWTVHVTTAPGQAACCPGCGQPARRVKERAAHSVKHLAVVPARVTWHKCRLRCENTACGTGGFAETGPVAAPGAAVSTHARTVMGHLVGDWLVPVSRVAASAGVSWHTTHDSFVGVATTAGIHLTDTTTTGGGDDGQTDPGEQTTTGSAPPAGQASTATAAADGPAASGPAANITTGRPRRSARGILPPVTVLGIDDHRRGKPLYHRDPAIGAWIADADRWQSVFVDAAGGHGLLGQVEGRAAADVTGWLSVQDPAWRAAITTVTIDMSTVYKSAASTSGLLPNASVVVDLFHMIQLANKTIGDVRRRATHTRYGGRGRAGDPEYAIKNLLVRGKENLSDRARQKILCTLADLGDAGRQIRAAWRAKELLRDLAALSPNRTGLAATRDKVADALEAFSTFAATVAATIPEIQTLAETVSRWRAEIARGVLTGHSNAAAEGINRLIKLVYRTAFGFTNVPNQQRRSRYAASRSTRPE